jgi:hypothetical protein
VFAASIVHPPRPGLLANERQRILDACAPWRAFPLRQPECREVLVLANPVADELLAVSVWDSQEAFDVALGQPGRAEAAAELVPLFARMTAPTFYEVLAGGHR